STLGNLNVASEWTAIALAATAVLLPHANGRARWLPIAALVCGGAYLMVNPTRSGKVAATCGLLLLTALRLRQRGWLPLALAAAGALLGGALHAALSVPDLDRVALRKELERGTVTLEVRFEIARGALQLLVESPVFGKGPGQFQVEYPRHRSQAEIEASSYERQFTTEVRTAHDDWLELLVDGGLPMLMLFAAMIFALQRGQRDRTRLVPMFVLLLLMLIRSPAFNAPAAALAFWLIGSPVETAPRGALRRRLTTALAVVAGLAMLALGVLPIAGNQAFVPYVAAKRDGRPAPVEAAEAAAWWMPYEPRWHEIGAREAMIDGNLQRAAHLAAKALELRPFSPPLLLLLAEVLARGGRYGEAIAVAERGLAFDPANPELRALVSTALAELGDVERAIREVVTDPHPLLREGLENHFADLAKRAGDRNELRQANRYLIEYLFVAIADRLGDPEPEVLSFVGELQG
ncbi:MAG: O-antigen ligase family protein, partial [Planctomycetes bacterium]|nr:O-antigen ligase family protein [Planctomycetota bacterium]